MSSKIPKSCAASNLSRGRVLARLWEIANLDPEKTRNGMSAQVKALSMIIAIEGLIPDRRAVAAQSKPAPAPVNPPFYVSQWMRNQQNQESVDPQPPPAQEEAAPELMSQKPQKHRILSNFTKQSLSIEAR